MQAIQSAYKHRAHPRSRGENLVSAGKSIIDGGSSPLTRGKRVISGCAAKMGRLIPAHAGKTRRRGRLRRDVGAHPRSRGENERYGIVTERKEGSSPLTRGKRIRV